MTFLLGVARTLFAVVGLATMMEGFSLSGHNGWYWGAATGAICLLNVCHATLRERKP